MSPRKIFQDAVCLVTGGASGIGAALCQQLSTAGATIVVTDVNQDAAESLSQSLPGISEAILLDVSQSAMFQRVVEDVVDRYGRIDFLFNNAGINILGEFQDLSPSDWRKIMDVNLWGVVYGCQAAYPQMLKQRSGHIINMSSGLGITPAPRNSAYSASKFAVVGLSEALRIEAADLGIHVSVVCPGWIRTPMLANGQVAGQSLNIGDVASHMPFAFSDVDKTARKILKGVRRRKAFIIYPSYVKHFQLLYHLLRPISDWWNRQEIRAFRRQRR